SRLLQLLRVPCAEQDVRQAVVSFVARILEERPIEPANGHLPRPGLCPRGRVLDGELVADAVRTNPCETLHDAHGIAGEDVLPGVARRTAEIRLAGEVRRLDDQRVPFPAAPRIARQET